MAAREGLKKIHDQLFETFGPQHWWPGETPLEICVGAILTQNTAWANVEKAIANIKAAGLLNGEADSLSRLLNHPDPKLAELIRPSGYFNLKVGRLKGFLKFVMEGYGGSLSAMFQEPLHILRPKLLAVHGVGPETADSILLYAGGKPVFVVDAYTLRIFTRLGVVPEGTTYHRMQEVFCEELPEDVGLYNEYHALIVMLGKDFCRPGKPRCGECPVLESCAQAPGLVSL
ncbi:MAG: endonuclease III domain-containing protein [Leptospirillia bacterium]